MSLTPDMRFYCPWTIREGSRGLQIEDATGFPLFYMPFEDEATRAFAEKRMNKKQARALATKITQMMNTLEKFELAVDRRVDAQGLAQPVRKPSPFRPGVPNSG